MAETDLAILTAFCRPYFDSDRRFRCPTPNNEILRELAQNGVYLDIDALRGHLRNLYAKFGIEDGLNAAQKRARLAELVYENSVIDGWKLREEAPKVPAVPVGRAPATGSAGSPASHPPAPGLPGPPEPPEPPEPSEPRWGSGWRGFLRGRWWWTAGAAALLAAPVVLGALGGSGPRPAPQAFHDTKASVARKSKCQPGRFCLGLYHHLSGGLYQGKISDRDLGDDTFYYYTDPDNNEKKLPPVTNQSWSSWNRGSLDVIVYDDRAHSGRAACLRRGPPISLPDRWRDRISSFKFATRSVCNRYEALVE